MAKTFDYAVKYRGKYYPPNTPIEEATTEVEKSQEATTEVEKSQEATTEVEKSQEATKKASGSRKKGDA